MKTLTLLKEVTELNEMCDKSSIVIYGAGGVANALVFYLAKMHYSNKIFCIAVSDKEGQPDEILGIPVCPLEEVCTKQLDVQFIIATLEKTHFDIYEKLIKEKIYDVKAVSNILYANLRQEIPTFEFEILHNVRAFNASTYDELKRVSSELWRVSCNIRELKRCILYNANTNDETLLPTQYQYALKEWYELNTGKTLDLKHPITYNEKIQWIKLYGITPLMKELTDKYTVREWIKNKIGEKYLIKLLGVWDCFDQIDFDTLPNRFVLKCNHGCGYNLIIQDKNTFNKKRAKRLFDSWMKINYAFIGGLELQYEEIKPRIIAEEYVENEDNELFDYKFWCFNGNVEFVMFLSQRNDELKMDNFDCDWNKLSFTYDYEQSGNDIPRPSKLDEMLDIAKKLSRGFPHVRVDLYLLNNGDIKFGEMTFTSDSGICNWSDEKVNYKLGNLIKLNNM